MDQEKIRLILVYGKVSDETCGKQQGMIDGRFTCGYREYASQPGGLIIYPRPQKVSLPWEMSLPGGKGLADVCKKYPDAVVWSVKRDKRKDRLLVDIPNFKLYYSSCAHHMINKSCNLSLVDTKGRMKNHLCVLHMKGKDPAFWKPVAKTKDYDYLLMGKRADKNELFFIQQLNSIKERRSILWLGGIKHRKKVRTHHKINVTKMLGPAEVRDQISRCKVGILFSEHPAEGFPQTFLEMTMCGVPVVYAGPKNPFYFFEDNSIRPSKKKIVQAAESLRLSYDSEACRKRAVENYSMEKSIERLLSFRK